jgi:hypothetical protein
MTIRFFWTAAAIAVVAQLGCGRTVRGENERVMSTAQPTALEEMTVSFTPGQQVITAKIGQVLLIVPPDAARRWQIDYASDILEVLTPPDQIERPGKAWRFRSSRAGETDVRVTAIADPGNPAPPAPMQFVITVRVTP